MAGGADRAAESHAGVGGGSRRTDAWACDAKFDVGGVSGDADPVYPEYGFDGDRVNDRDPGCAVLGKAGCKVGQ